MNRWHIAEIGFIIFSIIAVTWAIVAKQIVADQPYVNSLGALTLSNLQQNKTYTYPYSIMNPNNVTVMVYTFLYTEPELVRNYVVFDSSIRNGTEIEAYGTTETTFSLTVNANPYVENTEYYIKIGSFKKGIDY